MITANSPGILISEVLDDRCISRDRFSKLMNMSDDDVINLIAGNVPINDDLAYHLECALGIPADIWLKLEFAYREN